MLMKHISGVIMVISVVGILLNIYSIKTIRSHFKLCQTLVVLVLLDCFISALASGVLLITAYLLFLDLKATLLITCDLLFLAMFIPVAFGGTSTALIALIRALKMKRAQVNGSLSERSQIKIAGLGLGLMAVHCSTYVIVMNSWGWPIATISEACSKPEVEYVNSYQLVLLMPTIPMPSILAVILDLVIWKYSRRKVQIVPRGTPALIHISPTERIPIQATLTSSAFTLIYLMISILSIENPFPHSIVVSTNYINLLRVSQVAFRAPVTFRLTFAAKARHEQQIRLNEELALQRDSMKSGRGNKFTPREPQVY